MNSIFTMLFNIWMNIPFGYLLRFQYGQGVATHRVTLTKTLWVIIDSGPGTPTDALPLSLCSQKLVDECTKRLIEKYRLSEDQS